MRSPKDMDIVQVDISTKCHLKCSNCTRLIPHQPKREDMELETFERAVKSMDGWDRPNRRRGVAAAPPWAPDSSARIASPGKRSRIARMIRSSER